MRLTALVESIGHVCCRYRLSAVQSLLEKSGFRLELRALPKSPWGWLRLGQEVRGTDALILQRRLLSTWHLYLLRRAAPLLIFDFDDAVFLRDSYAHRGLQSSRRRKRFAATVRAADLITAGNLFLGTEASRWVGSDRVHVIPTCVDPGRYQLAEHRQSGKNVQLVWLGSSSTLRGLERARPLLEEIGRRRPGLSLKLVCDRFINLHGLTVVPCPWSEESEISALAVADIGISWVPDDLWSRGKCGLKVLQYMAAGLPVVANPVGVQGEFIQHGKTGFLADTPSQWVEAIGQLAGDPTLRRQMGRSARRWLEINHSVAVAGRRWTAMLQAMEQRRKSA